MGISRARHGDDEALGDVCEDGERLIDTASRWRWQESNLGGLFVS